MIGAVRDDTAAWLGRGARPQGAEMAKQGFRVMDSDLHVIEPRDLWTNYLDPRFLGRIETGTAPGCTSRELQIFPSTPIWK
jgi:hypothetical protein